MILTTHAIVGAGLASFLPSHRRCSRRMAIVAPTGCRSGRAGSIGCLRNRERARGRDGSHIGRRRAGIAQPVQGSDTHGAVLAKGQQRPGGSGDPHGTVQLFAIGRGSRVQFAGPHRWRCTSTVNLCRHPPARCLFRLQPALCHRSPSWADRRCGAVPRRSGASRPPA